MDWPKLRSTILGDDSAICLPNIELPMLPTALMELTKKLSQPDVDARELATIIEKDSGLTCELLRHLNSSAFGLRTKISSAQHAFSLLGHRATSLFLTTTAVKQAMRSCKSKLINFELFWAVNLERALFAQHLARLLKADPLLAFAGGMLQDCLLPILTNEFDGDYVEFLGNRSRQELSQFEQQRFGWNHAFATGDVMRQWGFPDDLICCILLHHRGLDAFGDPQFGRTSLAAVAASSLMPDPLVQSPHGMEQLLRLEQAWPALDLMQVAERVQAEFTEMSTSIPRNHIPFARRLERLAVPA
ncbi:MAG: HDOD domain-containing protein [Planctomycetota bacterium]|nr:HDOD domain-containing protein [Planctomycetota bacterium]